MKPGTVASTAIVVGERDREDLGDVDALAASIAAVGLLHPVVVTGSMDLVAGGRRLAAVKKLGWTEVPVTVVGDASELYDALKAEADENSQRKPLTPVEAVRARDRRIRVMAEDAKRRQGARTDLELSSNLEESSVPQRRPSTTPPVAEFRSPRVPASTPERKPKDRAKETRNAAAAGTGYSPSTLDKVSTILSAAERGVVKVNRQEVPVPPQVREVAREQLGDVAKTGAAVDRAHRAVAQALETYLPPDPDEPHRKWRRQFLTALIAGRKPMQFTAVAVAESADAECLDEFRRLVEDLNAYHSRVRAAVAESSPDNVRPLRAV